MSWEINTCELHKIKNVNDATREEVRRLVDYIMQFNKMTNMESMTLHSLRLSVDGKEINVKDVSEWEPGMFFARVNSLILQTKMANPASPFWRKLQTARQRCLGTAGTVLQTCC